MLLICAPRRWNCSKRPWTLQHHRYNTMMRSSCAHDPRIALSEVVRFAVAQIDDPQSTMHLARWCPLYRKLSIYQLEVYNLNKGKTYTPCSTLIVTPPLLLLMNNSPGHRIATDSEMQNKILIARLKIHHSPFTHQRSSCGVCDYDFGKFMLCTYIAKCCFGVLPALSWDRGSATQEMSLYVMVG